MVTWSSDTRTGFLRERLIHRRPAAADLLQQPTLSPAPSCLRSVSYLWSTQCQEEDFPDSSFCACYGHLSYGFWSQLFRVSIDFLTAIFPAFLTLSPGDPDWPHPTIVWHIGFVFVCQEIEWPGTHDPSTLTCMLCWDSRALVSRMCPAVPSPIFSWKRDFSVVMFASQWDCVTQVTWSSLYIAGSHLYIQVRVHLTTLNCWSYWTLTPHGPLPSFPPGITAFLPSGSIFWSPKVSSVSRITSVPHDGLFRSIFKVCTWGSMTCFMFYMFEEDVIKRLFYYEA